MEKNLGEGWPITLFKILAALLPAVIAGAVVVGCWYILKVMIQTQPPEIGVGVIGGIIWYFITSRAWQLFKWTLEDAEECLRNQPSSKAGE